MCDICEKREKILAKAFPLEDFYGPLPSDWDAYVVCKEPGGKYSLDGWGTHEQAREIARGLLKLYRRITPADLEILKSPCKDTPPEPPISAGKVTKSKAKRSGFVYILQSDRGLYKIGRTVDPASRAKTFGIQLPFEVEFVLLIKSDDYSGLEARLHERFAKKRVNGEWFKLSGKDIEELKREFE